MMDAPITFAALFEQLSRMAPGVDQNASLRINGEYVNELSVVVQNPLRQQPNEFGRMELGYDRMRPRVVDIMTNGQEAPKLPVLEIRDLPPRAIAE